MDNWKSTDGYLIFDFSEVNPALTTQTIPGIYARAKNLIANNKFVLLVNEGAHTPIPSVVAFVNNAYVIETVLYAYTILPNDSVRKTNHEYGAATLEDMTDVSILNPVTGDVLRYDSDTNYWINGKVKSSELNNDAGFITSADVPTIDDSTVSDHRVWSSQKVNNELLTKADTSAVPTKTSQLTNDSGYITSAAVPTKTSDLTNDSGFITSADVPTKTSQLTNDSGFITAADVPVIDDTAVVNNKVWSSYKTNAELLGKQNTLTAGTNITITGDTISATDTTYSEGAGIDITSNTISLDVDSLTPVTTLSDADLLPVSSNGTLKSTTAAAVAGLDKYTSGDVITISGGIGCGQLGYNKVIFFIPLAKQIDTSDVNTCTINLTLTVFGVRNDANITVISSQSVTLDTAVITENGINLEVNNPNYQNYNSGLCWIKVEGTGTITLSHT